MKVNLRIEPATTGLVFKKQIHKLIIDVEFTDAEKAAINKAGVLGHVLCTYPASDDIAKRIWEGDTAQVWVEHLCKRRPYTLSFADIVAANRSKEELIRGLQGLKVTIDMAQHGSSSDSFET